MALATSEPKINVADLEEVELEDEMKGVQASNEKQIDNIKDQIKGKSI